MIIHVTIPLALFGCALCVDLLLPEALLERTRDAGSGCLCRTDAVERYVICFDTKKCTTYPSRIRITMPTLKLSTTNIRDLKRNDLLEHRAHLRAFHLEMNDNFYRIEPGAFANMSGIVNVTISYNKNLQYLEPRAFDGLVNLRRLTLEKNGFHALKDFTYSITYGVLPALDSLTIASMPFERIVADDFVLKRSKLRHFYLTTCQIMDIDPTPLVEMKRLELLDLSENKLGEAALKRLLADLQAHGVDLKVLRLRNNALTELPYEALRQIGASNITRLNLARNQFEVIRSFPAMPQLEALDLEQSIILNITANAFDALPSLRYLYLSGNRFSSIPSATLLPHVEYLDISFVDGYLSFSGVDFANMTSLKYLNLSGNDIRRLNASTFNHLDSLEVLILQQCSIYFVNSLSFQSLNSLVHLDLQDNKAPMHDIQPHVFAGLWRLESLNLGKCGCDNIAAHGSIFANLSRLKALNLHSNNIQLLHPSVFAPLVSLEFLNLSGNALIAWDGALFVHNMRIRHLDLDNNQLKEVTAAMLEDFERLERLDLDDNRFVCKCPDINVLYQAYTQERYKNVLQLLEAAAPACSYPSSWNNRRLVDFLHQVDTDVDCNASSQLYVIPIMVVGGIALTTAIIALRYRECLRDLLFLVKVYLSRRYARRQSQHSIADVQYDYDAFVSYSNEDQMFVVRLVNELETKEPFLKLCVYERDFEIGSMITENVLESVAKSRKTLLIVSDAFIRSTWCRWEAQVAENKRLFWDRHGDCLNDSLIIIKLGKISTRHMGYTGILKYLMKTRVYLEWDNNPRNEYEFWCKLRKSLTQTNFVT